MSDLGWLGTGRGGFLNGVDGIISGYRFLEEVSQKGEPWIKCEVSVTSDGASEPTVVRPWLVGSPEDFQLVPGNDKTLILAEGARVSATSELGIFVQSLLAQKFTRFVASKTSLNLQPMVGTRCRFEQAIDERRKAKGEKRLDKKTGREYDYTNLVVTKIYALPALTPQPNGHMTPDDLTTLAKDTLIKMLHARSPIKDDQLSLLASQTLGVQHPQRVAVLGLLRTPAFLAQMATEGIVGYDAATKTVCTPDKVPF